MILNICILNGATTWTEFSALYAGAPRLWASTIYFGF